MLQTFNEKNRDLLVNINGELIPRASAGVSPFDSVVLGGDAVWEGMRLYQGRIFRLTEHLDRLRSSALALAYTDMPSRERLIEEIRRTLIENEMHHDVHIRLTLTRGEQITLGMDPRLNQSGPTLIVVAEHKPPVDDQDGISLVTSAMRRFPPDCLDPKIHHANLLQSILAKIQANASGADDALMLDPRGFVADSSAAHVFLVEEGKLVTPSTRACPEGVTRATVLELCTTNEVPCEVRDVSLTDVYRADEMLCTGTMGELVAVTSVDGRPIGDGGVGPETRYIKRLFQEETERAGVRVVD